jgi:NDP-sugar pyrophosphorylase family protein
MSASNGTGAKGVRAVVLAGGFGTRLAPYTSVLPKPLMPIGNRAILEIVVDQLTASGFREITFCVGYLSHLIRAVFDNRVDSPARISYVHEQQALGTAGPLRLVDGLDSTFVVMNGDVLTTLDYKKLLRRHRESGCALTIATHQRVIKHDYGVLHLDGLNGSVRRVTGYEEKPEIVSTVSMGIYVLEPRALEHVPEAAYFDFPDLVQALLDAGEEVGAYNHDGLWFDIGRQEDYALAAEVWATDEPATPAQKRAANGRNGRADRAQPRRSRGSATPPPVAADRG